jgi:hypothetical protein
VNEQWASTAAMDGEGPLTVGADSLTDEDHITA